MLLAQAAMFRALTEEGPESLTYRLCEYAYATGVDLVDYDSLLVSVRDGIATEPPPLPSHEETMAGLRDSVARIDTVLQRLA